MWAESMCTRKKKTKEKHVWQNLEWLQDFREMSSACSVPMHFIPTQASSWDTLSNQHPDLYKVS